MSYIIDVLQLRRFGLLSKEATVAALSVARGRNLKFAEGSPYMDLAKMIALQAGVYKGLNVVENLAGKAVGAIGRRGNDALFQKLMREHPAMADKDPARTKANFDYITREAPHLIDHPLILGDYVGNMTALKTTDPATLKTIAETEKARYQTRPQNEPWKADAAQSVAELYAKGLEPVQKPSEQAQQKANELLVDMEAQRKADEMMAKLHPQSAKLAPLDADALEIARNIIDEGRRGLKNLVHTHIESGAEEPLWEPGADELAAKVRAQLGLQGVP